MPFQPPRVIAGLTGEPDAPPSPSGLDCERTSHRPQLGSRLRRFAAVHLVGSRSQYRHCPNRTFLWQDECSWFLKALLPPACSTSSTCAFDRSPRHSAASSHVHVTRTPVPLRGLDWVACSASSPFTRMFERLRVGEDFRAPR